jgi:tetratricopeptide (TPR) repeat protein
MMRTIAGLFGLLIASATVARAQPSDDDKTKRAAALYDEGRRHFDIQEYADAITAWKQAYLLSNEPILLFNIGQAFRLEGDCAQANRYYVNYKDTSAAQTNHDELDAAMAKCAGIAPAVGTTDTNPKPPDATQPPAGQTSPSGEPLPFTSSATPPPHESDGGASPAHLWRIAGIGLISAGALSLAGSVYFVIRAHDDASTISKEPRGTAWTSVQAVDQTGHDAARDAAVFGGIAAAAVVAGGALWWMHRNEGPQLAVSIGANRVGASVSCAF